MTDKYSFDFKNALMNHDLEELKRVPKADLHNHFALGGNREYIFDKTGIWINACDETLMSMDKMHRWSKENLANHFSTQQMRKLMIEATFIQAKQDGVSILEIGEDVWGLKEYFNDDVGYLVGTFEEIQQRVAPDIELRLQIGLSRHCAVDYLAERVDKFLKDGRFYSIDLYGDEFAQPIERFASIYDKAKSRGLNCKAHVGEWGSAQDVKQAVEVLHLDEVQHGISAVTSQDVMLFLKENNIRLNITPTSNIKLNRIQSYQNHPIQLLHRFGIDVTIGSDDVLIFDSDVSKEYLRLYQNGCLTAEELDSIRLNGLKSL
jgi:hypothetical protein